MLGGLLMVLLLLTSVFLILLVLVQRGRGGGLAGAFGGMGGQSAFGTKAGDLFTRITIFVAAFSGHPVRFVGQVLQRRIVALRVDIRNGSE